MATALRSAARVQLEPAGDELKVALAGDWLLTAPRPSGRQTAAEVAGELPARPRGIVVEDAGLGRWDCALVLFLYEMETALRASGTRVELGALPAGARRQLEQMRASHEKADATDRSENFLSAVGLATFRVVGAVRQFSTFVGECTLAAVRVARQPGAFRWKDCFEQMQQCGAMALPIVSLVSFLVGLILAFQAAIFMRQFGADIYVADFVGISMLREMGPLMAGVTLAGRTGAAFAAQIANMKAGEEIDALRTLGVRPVDFLVLPRLLALGVMLPVLTLYANCLGVLGGVVVTWSVLEIPPAAFWVEMLTIVDLSDLFSGLIKAGTYGVLIGLAGCLRGLEAERSAAGVGGAATSAVVTAIVLMILANATYAVVFNILGL